MEKAIGFTSTTWWLSGTLLPDQSQSKRLASTSSALLWHGRFSSFTISRLRNAMLLTVSPKNPEGSQAGASLPLS